MTVSYNTVQILDSHMYDIVAAKQFFKTHLMSVFANRITKVNSQVH